ncbi:plasmid stability protein [Variovorax boronicumulans]|uniref:Plasmid stability protein n=1 Tax=Variovorax boronicumulans TaxID=436515 RepID=A0AAW8CV86_9BURK|nr:Arc family DNA-binding protein [Variovorax boronicumulans]MDP9895333.1 plasmid stability protein [Variovorax boronicumulans]MDQ0055373.1 plasmid stability protein [Variovorax boronicumulans]
MATEQTPPTPVRLPDDLKKDLKAAAEANDRSLNGEIVNRLRSTFKGKRSRQPSANPPSPDTLEERSDERQRTAKFVPDVK